MDIRPFTDWTASQVKSAALTALFPLGQLVATPGALDAIWRNGAGAWTYLSRHVTGDWGDLAAEDRAKNTLSLREGFRLLSAYSLSDGTPAVDHRRGGSLGDGAAASRRVLISTLRRYLPTMFGKFPMGDRWAAELLGEILPPSRAQNINVHQGQAVADRLVRVWFSGEKGFGRFTERVRAAFLMLDNAFEQSPEPIALIVDQTFERLRELQQRESSLDADTHVKHDDNLEAKFGAQLDFFEFLFERMYRTLAAPLVVADAITRTGAPLAGLIDNDGRASRKQVEALEAGRGLQAGVLTGGVEHHLRNTAAHHLYSILDDNRIRLWDVYPDSGKVSWGPVEWTYWELHTHVRRLFVTCSVLLIGLACFDITNGRTIRARGWGITEPPRPRRRDIMKSELYGPGDCFGLAVDSVEVAADGALVIGMRVKGDTVIEQTKRILVGGSAPMAFRRDVRTEWGPLREQVYGFLQRTFDIHGGYDVVRLNVTSSDGQTSLGQVVASLEARRALIPGRESIEALRARLTVDALVDEKIPVVLEGPIVPAN